MHPWSHLTENFLAFPCQALTFFFFNISLFAPERLLLNIVNCLHKIKGFKSVISKKLHMMENSCFMFIYRNQMAVEWASARSDNSSADSASVQIVQQEGES